MRIVLLAAGIALAALAFAQQPPVPAANPAVKPAARPAVRPVSPAPQALPALKLPRIQAVERAGASPGPAVDRALLNGEAIRVRGTLLGTTQEGRKLALRRDGKLLALRINPNVRQTGTEIGAYVPALDAVVGAGLATQRTADGAYEVVLTDAAGKVLSTAPVRLVFRRGHRDDIDGDGSAVIDGDCNDFDARRYPGNIEICDAAGLDEDCDTASYGERDADGDHFIDAMCRNYDASGRKVSGGNDCNDNDVTANPIRPERCG